MRLLVGEVDSVGRQSQHPSRERGSDCSASGCSEPARQEPSLSAIRDSKSAAPPPCESSRTSCSHPAPDHPASGMSSRAGGGREHGSRSWQHGPLAYAVGRQIEFLRIVRDEKPPIHSRESVRDATGRLLSDAETGCVRLPSDNFRVLLTPDDEWPGLRECASLVRVDSSQVTNGLSHDRSVARRSERPEPLACQAVGGRRGRMASRLTAPRLAVLRELLGDDTDELTMVTLVVRDERAIGRRPSRATFSSEQACSAREIAASASRDIRRQRVEWAQAPLALIHALGGRVVRHTTLRQNAVTIVIQRRRVCELLGADWLHDAHIAREHVAVDLDPCTGLPNPFDPAVDAVSTYCGSGPVETWMDSVNTATGLSQYVEAGYTGGLVEGGLASWADDWHAVGSGLWEMGPSLAVGVADRDTNFMPLHPAFENGVTGQSRVRYYFGASTGGLTTTMGEVPYSGSSHGSSCAAVLMADVTHDQDPAVTVEQEARSGAARGALGFWAGSGSPGTDLLEHLSADDVDGLDVISHSASDNSGYVDGVGWGGDYDCPTWDEARGLDPESSAIVDAYLNDSVLTVKSAGNMHSTGSTSNVESNCTTSTSAPYQISAPGASPAAVPVGALSSANRTPHDLQEVTALWDGSAQGKTADGRDYPLLVVSAFSCGPAATRWLPDRYTNLGATSGAAPRVAGAIAMFKHWYLQHQGPAYANQPGRLLVNVLTMGADGYADNARGVSGARRMHPPHGGFGVGRLRMRLFEPAYVSGTAFRGSAAAALTSYDTEIISLGAVPPDVRRLRITLWWLEVNTDESEDKALVAAMLYKGSDLLDQDATSSNCVLRMQYECGDAFFGNPPSGDLELVLLSGNVPTEERYEGRNYRTIYVSWFWETGADIAKVRCVGDPAEADCKVAAPISDDAEDGAAAIADSALILDDLAGEADGSQTDQGAGDAAAADANDPLVGGTHGDGGEGGDAGDGDESEGDPLADDPLVDGDDDEEGEASKERDEVAALHASTMQLGGHLSGGWARKFDRTLRRTGRLERRDGQLLLRAAGEVLGRKIEVEAAVSAHGRSFVLWTEETEN